VVEESQICYKWISKGKRPSIVVANIFFFGVEYDEMGEKDGKGDQPVKTYRQK